MISPEIRARIRLYFYAKHGKVGTIARKLDIHSAAVRNATVPRSVAAQLVRPFLLDFLLAFANAINLFPHHGNVVAATRRKK